MPRFSIRQLLIATAVAAVGCFALLHASPIWAATFMGSAALILAAAILLAVFRDGERRAYWIGFATFGWLYLLLCFGGIFVESGNQFGWKNSITAQLAGALYDRMYVIATNEQPQFYRPPSSDPFAPSDPFADGQEGFQRQFVGPNEADFFYVAHSLWTLLLAVCGGWFAHWLYVTRERRRLAAGYRLQVAV